MFFYNIQPIGICLLFIVTLFLFVFSETQVPQEIISTGRSLLIKFVTDDTINWKGFSAAFVLAGADERPVTRLETYTREPSNNHPKPPVKKMKKTTVVEKDKYQPRYNFGEY